MKIQEIEQAIDECVSVLEASHCPFSPWEVDFIESIYDQFIQKGKLSDKQVDRLVKVWEKI